MNYAVNPMRWWLKKGARKAFVLLSMIYSRVRRGSVEPCIRVLTYHRFTQQKFDPVAVRPEDFEQQLRWLLANVDVLDAASFTAILRGDLELHRDAVLITVDDGHHSFFEHAYPLLITYKIPALLFVCPALIDSKYRSHEFMSWDELRIVSSNEITVASHGNNHVSLGKIHPREAEKEIVDARERLKQCVGVNHSFFSFPFGTRQDFSESLGTMLFSQGYQFCFSSIHGRCEPLTGTNIFPRVKVESGESLDTFSALVKGHLDAWRLVDDWAWWLQQRGRL